jgi:hypothetical protein
MPGRSASSRTIFSISLSRCVLERIPAEALGAPDQLPRDARVE